MVTFLISIFLSRDLQGNLDTSPNLSDVLENCTIGSLGCWLVGLNASPPWCYMPNEAVTAGVVLVNRGDFATKIRWREAA